MLPQGRPLAATDRRPGALSRLLRSRTIGQALVGALVPGEEQRGKAAAVRLRPLELLPAAAEYHRVPGYVTRAYADLEPLQSVLPRLQHAAEAATLRHVRALADHRRMLRVLEALEVEHLVVKGPVLAEHHHGGADLRSYRDLDVLVRGRDLRRVHQALAGDGWPGVDRNWVLMRQALAGEVHLIAPFGTPLDLHWQLLFRDTLRAHFPVVPEELFARARQVQVGGFSMATMDPVDTLLHLCLHASLSGGHRLVWLKDVERAIAVDRPDWDEVVRRARQRRLGLPTALVLQRARLSLEAAVPRAVLSDLLPSRSARAVLSVVDRLVPPERSSSRGSPSRLLAKAARGSGAETAREVGRAVSGMRADVLAAVLRPAHRPDPGALLLEDVGGEAERNRYFSAVESACSAGVTET